MGEEIRLSANININRSADTRAPYEQNVPTLENQFDAMVWASTSGNYQNNNQSDDTSTEYHTTVYFQSATNQLLRAGVIYPSNAETHVKIFGLYPNSGWSSNVENVNNTYTSFTFDGDDDLMYAPQVEGYIGISTAPTLNFYHLLTLLRVEVYADPTKEGVISSWGKIKSMSLNGQYNTLTISDLSTPLSFVENEDWASRQAKVATKVSLNPETGPMNFYTTANDEAFDFSASDEATVAKRITLTTSPTEVAYILCAPKLSSDPATAGSEQDPTNEYIMTLNTENRSGVTVNIDLKNTDGSYFTGSTMGHEFVLQLKFGEGGFISAKATVTPWGEGGYIIHDVTE